MRILKNKTLRILYLLEKIDNGSVKFYWVATNPEFSGHFELKIAEDCGHTIRRLSAKKARDLQEWLAFDEENKTWKLNKPSEMILQMSKRFDLLNATENY